MRKRLKHERNKRKWTQEFVAKSVGITARAYQYYESGQHEPTLSIAIKLGQLFEMTPNELLQDYTPETVREGSR